MLHLYSLMLTKLSQETSTKKLVSDEKKMGGGSTRNPRGQEKLVHSVELV